MKSLSLYVLEDKSGDLKQMNTLSETIIRDLRKLEKDILTDKVSVERERNALRSDFRDGRGSFLILDVGVVLINLNPVGRIADHVETMNQIAERQDEKVRCLCFESSFYCNRIPRRNYTSGFL